MVPLIEAVSEVLFRSLRYIAEVMAEAFAQILGVDSLRTRERRQETLDERIAGLSRSLQQAAGAMTAIEAEVAERASLVERLKADAARYEKLVALKYEEVQAVAQTLRGELETTNRRSFWANQAANAILVSIGILAGWLLTR